MRNYSPNLKPEQLRNHADAAQQLGVPRGNILDLRKDDIVPATAAVINPADQSLALTDSSQKNWWQRRREQRLAKAMVTEKKAAQSALAVFTAVPAEAMATASVPPPISEQVPKTVVETVVEPTMVVVPPAESTTQKKPTVPVCEDVMATESIIAAAPVPEAAQLFKHHPRQPRRSWRTVFQGGQWRPAVTFMCVSLFCVAPVAALALYHQVNSTRAKVETVSRAATQQLNQAAHYSSEFQFNNAATAFDSAATDFRSARDQLTSVNTVLTPLLHVLPSKGNQFASAENILIAGEQLAAAGTDLVKAFAVLDEATGAGGQGITGNTTDLLVTAHSAFRPALPRLERAALALQDIDLAAIPEQYRDDVALAQTTVPVIAQNMSELLSLSETLLVILGHDTSKRYLVLFQNNRELRATGGFIGSYATVNIFHGQVKAMDIPGGGSYDITGNLAEKVISPQPLHLVNAHWQMQDANWWPDFPTSAEKIQWFYRKSGGSTVDGVITLTPDIIEQMLTLTGPIELPDYGVTVVADNFYDITQAQAERKFDDTRESKKFIADLTPQLLDKLFTLDAKNFLPVLQIIYNGLSEKDILLYFNDPFLENELSQRGWTGEIKSTNRDYLMVVDTNIAGGKTDAVISETIEHNAAIQTDGSVIDTVTVSRTHHGSTDDAFANVNNMDYLRLYTPAGSELLSAEGFIQPDPKLFLQPDVGYTTDSDMSAISGDVLIDEQTHTRINQEFGKTVFANWVETRPGETSRVTVSYRLPFTIQSAGVFQPTDYYSLLVQKQPGSFDPLLLTQLSYPIEYTPRWSYPNVAGQLNQALTRDVLTGVVLEKT